jgi:cytochrome P450
MALPAGPPLPALIQTLLWIFRPIEYMETCRAKYGDIFTLRFTGLGVSHRIVFIADPSGVRAIFGGDPEVLRAGAANVALAVLLGEHSLLLLDGREHLRQRKLMLPPFHGERMRSYESTMREITLDHIHRWPRERPFPILPEMQSITLEVILRTVFGFDDATLRDEMRGLLQRMLSLGSGTARVALVAFARHELGGRSPWARFMAARRDVDAALHAQIQRRRASEPEKHDDVLSMLLTARDEEDRPLSDEELRDELITLLVAGHETTATALAWAFDLLLHHPQEMDALLSSLDTGEGRYVDAVIKETLRIRPVVPIVARYLGEPFSVMGHEIPARTVVAPCIYLTQRDPEVYPDANRFRPQRFLGGAPDPYAWLPFGGGVRRCLGASFAQFEMRVVLRTILSELQLRAAGSEFEQTTRRAVTLVPRGGVRVSLLGNRHTVQTAPSPDERVPISA